MSVQLDTLFDDLRLRGVTMRRLWETRRDGKRITLKHPADVTFYVFCGDGFTPSVTTAIIIDYGSNDGFGFYVDNVPTKLSEISDMIAKPYKS